MQLFLQGFVVYLFNAAMSRSSKILHLVIFLLNLACVYKICIALNFTGMCWCGIMLNL